MESQCYWGLADCQINRVFIEISEQGIECFLLLESYNKWNIENRNISCCNVINIERSVSQYCRIYIFIL